MYRLNVKTGLIWKTLVDLINGLCSVGVLFGGDAAVNQVGDDLIQVGTINEVPAGNYSTYTGWSSENYLKYDAPSTYTISCWCMYSGFTGKPFGSGGGRQVVNSWSLILGSRLIMNIWIDNTFNYQNVSDNSSIDGWNHVAVTYRSASDISLYLNGVKTVAIEPYLCRQDLTFGISIDGPTEEISMLRVCPPMLDSEVLDLYNEGTAIGII